MVTLRLRPGRDATTPDDAAPDWVILDLHGSYPAYRPGPPIQAMLQQTEALESVLARLDHLAAVPWVTAVLVRVAHLTADMTTCRALGRALGRLAEHKRVVVYLPQVSMRALLVSAGVREVVTPESAEVLLPGFAAEQVYLGAFLSRHGVSFENLRIGEYKSALTPFSQDHMDEAEREQLSGLLSTAERHWIAEMAAARGVDAERAAGWLDADLTSAAGLLEAGLVTRIGYDDEIVVPVDQQWNRAFELLRPQLAALRRKHKADGVAVVPVIGAIVSGRSRPTPPFPFLSGPMAGSDTVVAALRKAERDEHTKAVVLYVDSGGGSALASDVIGRAVERCTKPVVAVMGEVAASGGYYVLAQADRVLTSPYTITGSIGVVVGKPVLAEFNERHGFNPEVVGRERALFGSVTRPFSPAEREWAERMMREVYDRFVARVATGRGLSPQRVDEVGRGRIWSGADAVEIGLADELGDVADGVVAARRLAGLGDDAPARAVTTGFTLPGLPELGKGAARNPAAAVAALWPFGEERVLMWLDRSVVIR